ncbi:MAG: hypothetical protein RBR02_10150 [Desulfuromonadaceae bacterium]|nr:hypothetical protein [Desulfuromonadaceae bacterium]
MAKKVKDHDLEINNFKSRDSLDNVFQPIQTEQMPSNTAHLERLLEEVYSKKDIELKTELNTAEIIALTQLDAYARRFKSPIAKFVSMRFKELNVSKKRQGRKEFVQVSKSMQPSVDFEMPEPRSRFLGK